jgi:hypothetical protein
MSVNSTKPIKELSSNDWNVLIEGKEIIVGAHAMDHLSTCCRKTYEPNEITTLIQRVTPRRAFLQLNGRYCAYFRLKNSFRKIIISIEQSKAVIISFMDVPELPRLELTK